MKKEILRILYKYIFLLLIAAILCTGTVFARYASSNSVSTSSTVANFNYTFDVNSASATAFTNVSYYYTDSTDPSNPVEKVSSGATVRYINFTLNSNESAVSASSTLSFSADYDFLSNIAFQITEVNGDTETVLTPQYVMSELLSGNGNTSGYKDYGGKTFSADQQFTVSYTSTSFIATGSSNNAEGITISLTTVSNSTNRRTYIYGRGSESKLDETTIYNDLDAPEVYVECDVSGSNYSTLQITLPEFAMNAGDTKTFRFYFTTINATDLTDTSLYFDTLAAGSSCNSYYYNVEDVTAYTDAACTTKTDDITVKVKIAAGTSTYTYYYVTDDGDVELTETTGGSGIYGSVDGGIYIRLSDGNFSYTTDYTGTETYVIAKTYDSQGQNGVAEPTGVIYPMDLSIIFAQASEN